METMTVAKKTRRTPRKKDLSITNNAEFGRLSMSQALSQVKSWQSISRLPGFAEHTNGSTHFVCIKNPGNEFDYEAMTNDPLMINGQVSTVCERLNARCLYLESANEDALKFILWKYSYGL